MKFSKRLFVFISVVFLSVMMVSPLWGADRKLIVTGEEFAPFEFVKDGKVVGIDIDIASAIFKKMGIPVEFRIEPWKRAWKNVEEGKVEAVMTTSRKDKRKPFVWYPEENMWVSQFCFLYNKSKKIDGFKGYETAKAQKLKIGINHGNSYNDSFWAAFPYKNGATTFQGDMLAADQLNAQLEPVSKFERSLQKLAIGRVDLVLSDKTVGLYTAKLKGVRDKIEAYEPPLYSKGYPMPFVKNSSYPNLKQIADKYEQGLKDLKASGEYQKIMDKWLN